MSISVIEERGKYTFLDLDEFMSVSCRCGKNVAKPHSHMSAIS